MLRARFLLVLLLAVALPPGAGRASAPAFGPRALVGEALGEPSMAIGPDGAIYVVSPAAGDGVFKSTDGGATWVPLPLVNPGIGGDDDHIVVAADNTAYVTGQWTAGEVCESVSIGPLGGSAWITQPVACEPTVGFRDRPWIAVSGAGGATTLYDYFTDPCCGASRRSTQVVMRSEDGGLTWTKAGTVTGEGYFPGYLLADDARGKLYASTTRGTDAVIVCSSADRAATWTCRDVAPLAGGDNGLDHVFLAQDRAGTLYTAWTDATGGRMDVFVSHSADGGQTWSAPQDVTPFPGTHIFPTIDAGAPGRAAVAWYEGPPGDPNDMPASAAWYPVAAISSNADAASAEWQTARVTEMSNHSGTLCTQGSTCGSLKTRALLDFFTVKVDALGRANVTWADDTTAHAIYFARSL
jgi:hypothetical protein